MPEGKEGGTPNSLTLLEYSIAVKKHSRSQRKRLDPVPDRPTSANPGFKFCYTILY